MTDRITPVGGPRSERSGVPVLAVKNLHQIYALPGGLRRRPFSALRDVSFVIHPGEIVALVGESGSGKSTTLRLIARLEQPHSGEICLHGENVLVREPKQASLDYRRRVQMIFQDPFSSLNPVHPVGYQLGRPLLCQRITRTPEETQRKVLALLESVGLEPALEFAQKYPHQMSGGQRQRVAIARALSVDPELILADEPTSMLDVSIRMGVLNLLDEMKIRRGLSYLYVTHDLASARYLADRTLVMYAGQIVEQGPSEALMATPAHPYTRLLLEAVPHPTRSTFQNLPVRPEKNGSPAPVAGCSFSARCPEVIEQCKTEPPPLVHLRPRPGPRSAGDSKSEATARFIRCHRAGDLG